MLGEYTSVGYMQPDSPKQDYSELLLLKPIEQSEPECAECVICQSMVGRDIGGDYLGMHWKNPVVICDWCKMCLEDRR